MSNDHPPAHRLALGEERVVLDKRLEDRQRVRVRSQVETREELVTADLRSEEVTVERVAVNREVQELPEVRQEGDLLIVPVVEEEIVVTKRLVLKEELRIRRRTSIRHVEQAVPARRVEAIVERARPAEGRTKT